MRIIIFIGILYLLLFIGAEMKKTNNITGKNELLEQLFIKYSKLMFYIADNILKDKHLAEDAVQKAFLKLEKSKINIDSLSSARTRSFMTIVIRNVSYDMFNTDKRNNLTYDDENIGQLPDENLQPLDIIVNREIITQVQSNLRKLDEKYGDVFLLRYFCEYSISEIAEFFEISEASVRVRLYRAKKSVIEQIKGESI
jgi:RNA polymerase sigma-70 factor, ECF subfamily